MEVRNHRRDSEDSLFNDFVALPDQFRPKKTFKSNCMVKNPTVVPKIQFREENTSELKNALHNDSLTDSLAEPIDKSQKIQKPVVEKVGGKLSPRQFITSNQNQVKSQKEDSPSDFKQKAKTRFSKKDMVAKKNVYWKEPLSLERKLSQMSVETVRCKDDVKVKRSVWNNNLAFQTGPQVWKFNGATLEPDDKTDSVKQFERKSTGSRKKNSVWDDNLDTSTFEDKVHFGYISKETRNGSSTITACWGDLHRKSEVFTSPKHRLVSNNKSVNKRQIQKVNFPSKLEVKPSSSSAETPRSQPIPPKPQRRCYRRAKTNVIRHEIRIIHVNDEGRESEKSLPKQFVSIQDNESLEEIVPFNLKERIFHFKASGQSESPELSGPLKCQKDNGFQSALASMDCEASLKSPVNGYEERNECNSAMKAAKENFVEKEKTLISFGREISELIAGSHLARSIFVACYDKWIPVRNRTIEIMEQLSEKLIQTRDWNNKVTSVVDLIGKGTQVASMIPHVKVNLVARIIAAITPFISKLFKSSPNIKQAGMTETEMINHITDDIEATIDIYFYGTQCNYQFQETGESLMNFQTSVDAGDFSEFTGPEADFMRGISFFSSKNLVVYYRRLYKCFVKLNESRTSEVSRAFCQCFEDSPPAIGTVELLHWRFPAQIEDNEAFQRAWQDVTRVFTSSNSNTEVMGEIRDCINILRNERRKIENNMADLKNNL